MSKIVALAEWLQEAFYSQFKLELGETRNYETTGHLAEAVYR